jgi:MerR family transcriptional regulator/heat shock protein HspR|tara:strand:+ start:81 stop:473 length:393 start_codon:yes stop_codon:yes gene_type:complete
MSKSKSDAVYFISVASSLSGIHPQTIRIYEEKGLVKPYRTKGGTRRYSQDNIDRLIQIQQLTQRGMNLEGIKVIYELKSKIDDLQKKINNLEDEVEEVKNIARNRESEIHKSYKHEIVIKDTTKTPKRKS